MVGNLGKYVDKKSTILVTQTMRHVIVLCYCKKIMATGEEVELHPMHLSQHPSVINFIVCSHL